jgi:hypothetical protein
MTADLPLRGALGSGEGVQVATEVEDHEAVQAVAGALTKLAPRISEDRQLAERIVRSIHEGSTNLLAALLVDAADGQVQVDDVEIAHVAQKGKTTVTIVVGVTFGGFTIGLQFSYTKDKS